VAWEVDGEGHLDELAVTPAYGRRGVGRALVDEVVAWTVATWGHEPSLRVVMRRPVAHQAH